MRFTQKSAFAIAKKYKINLEVVPLDQLTFGLNVELEHGKKLKKLYKKVDITHDNVEKTLMIAVAHLLEYPDYYKRLKKMEEKAEKYWDGKKKPSIFLK